jgi:hypothetical protein
MTVLAGLSVTFSIMIGIFLIFGSTALLTDWIWHLGEAKDNTTSYAWGNFDDFLRMYNSTKWTNIYKDFVTQEDKNMNNISWVSENGTIRFNRIGMKLDLISYIRYKIWWKNKKELVKNIKQVENPWGREVK